MDVDIVDTPVDPSADSNEDAGEFEQPSSMGLPERIAAAMKKNFGSSGEPEKDEQVIEAERVLDEMGFGDEGETQKETQAQPEKVETTPPVDDRYAALEAKMVAQSDMFDKILQRLGPQKAPEAPPEPPAPRGRGPGDIMMRAAREELGEHATDRQVHDFAVDLRVAVLNEAHLANPESEYYEPAKNQIEEFKTRSKRYDESTGLRAEMAAMKAEMAEMREAPQRQTNAKGMRDQLGKVFVNPDPSFQKGFGGLIELDKTYNLSSDLADFTMEQVKANPGDQGAFFQETSALFGQIQTKLGKAVKALQAAGPAKEVLLEALSAGEPQGYQNMLKKVASGGTSTQPNQPSRRIAPGPTQNRAPETPPAEDEFEAFRSESHEERVKRAMRKRIK